ncbi:unannotated protein [freshwater metagenome]|uniref:Unannotated protein n=1 Tax=freshwater metagenome TaxID=449393 RepID=A0A6J6T5Y6_9ZZZZ
MADDERADHPFADRLDGLDLEPGTNEMLGNVSSALVRGDLD